MSLMDAADLSPAETVAQYILARDRRSLCLSPEDHRLIVRWLAAAEGDSDLVLAVLDDILGDSPMAEGRARRLLYLDRKVMRGLSYHQHLGAKGATF